MSEARLFRSVVLTLITYGSISFLQWGKFLVPLPAFELVILGLSLYFSYLSWKSDKIEGLLFLLFGLTQFLGRSYNYEFFLSDTQLRQLSDLAFIDIFLITSIFLLAFLFLRQRTRESKSLVASLLLSSFIIVCGLIPDEHQLLNLLPLMLISAVFIYEKKVFVEQLSIWLFLLVFAACRTLTLQLL
jgi:phosphoglycerol transferase MdoB-like AlkP superfamily enzyme